MLNAVARADDGTDDTIAIQSAIDQVAYAQSLGVQNHGTVRLAGGTLHISDTIHLGYGATQQVFSGVTLEGAGMAFSNGFAGTIIDATALTDRPAIAIHGGRNVVIKNLTIIGPNDTYILNGNLGHLEPSIADLEWLDWIDPALPASASSSTAPLAGIAIDPYAGNVPAVPYPAVNYPDFLGPQTQYNKAFSSNTLIDNVQIQGFVIGVAQQPCDADGNGDFTKLRRVAIRQCASALSIGNSQSRDVHVSDSLFAQVHTVFETGRIGRKIGKPQALFTSCEISQCINWFDVPNPSYGGPVTFKNCYGELIYRLGTLGTGLSSASRGVVFDQCEFSFTSWVSRGIPSDTIHVTSDGFAGFTDCTFDAVLDPGVFGGRPLLFVLNIPAEQCDLRRCLFLNSGTPENNAHKIATTACGGVVLRNASTNIPNGFSVRSQYRYDLNTWLADVGQPIISDQINGSRRYGLPIYAHRGFGAGNDNDYPQDLMSLRRPYAMEDMASVSQQGRIVTLDATGEAQEWQLIQSGGDVGDVVWDTVTSTVFVVINRLGLVLTLEAVNNLDRHGNLSKTIGLTGTLYAINTRRFLMRYTTVFSAIQGNNVSTNVQRVDTYSGHIASPVDGVQVGDELAVGNGATYKPLPPNFAKITAVDEVAKTITFNGAFEESLSGERFNAFVRVLTP